MPQEHPRRSPRTPAATRPGPPLDRRAAIPSADMIIAGTNAILGQHRAEGGDRRRCDAPQLPHALLIRSPGATPASAASAAVRPRRAAAPRPRMQLAASANRPVSTARAARSAPPAVPRNRGTPAPHFARTSGSPLLAYSAASCRAPRRSSVDHRARAPFTASGARWVRRSASPNAITCEVLRCPRATGSNSPRFGPFPWPADRGRAGSCIQTLG